MPEASPSAYDRHVFAVGQITRCALGVAKHAVVGGRHVGVAEQVLAEDLAPLQFGGRLGGPEYAQFFIREGVDNPLGQRSFRPHDREPDLFRLGELDQPRDVSGGNVHVLAALVLRRAGIARRNEYLRHVRALCELPGHCMLAPTVADHQNFHRESGT